MTAIERLKAKKEKWYLFALEYIKDFNATRAAEAVGYKGKHVKRRGFDILHKREVQDALVELTENKTKEIDASADRVLLELARIAFLDVNDLFDGNGRLRDIDQIPEDARRALSSFEIEVDKDGNTIKKVRTVAKDAALNMLGRYHKLFTDKVEQSGTIVVRKKFTGASKSE